MSLWWDVKYRLRRWLGYYDDFSFREATGFVAGEAWDLLILKEFRYKVARAIKYAIRGYNSCDFDSQAALEDFCLKLERLAEHLDNHAITTTCHEDARQIRRAVWLFRRVMEDDYYFENVKPVEEKYGETVMNWEAPKDKNGCVTSTQLFGPRSKSVPADQPTIKRLEREAMDRAIYQRKRDWEYALRIVQKYFWHWWD